MRKLLLIVALVGFAVSADAHPPNHAKQPVYPRIDVIGPVGNRLPASYARRYNRPRYITGKIAYWIAPSSQEAMAWHRAEHRGAYHPNLPRLETHYFYPKPYEALPIGPRPRPEDDSEGFLEELLLEGPEDLPEDFPPPADLGR